ncbi:MAG: DUF1330 domain-containing protein [Gammaproteobacteria bacterium]|nr:DUF1330 domain-containing protein [Gammaproteobacteria bacterium]
MSAYVVTQVEIHDRKEYQKYLDGFLLVSDKYGGELLTTSGHETLVLEGEWAYPRTVIMRFPSVDAARNWYQDPEYQKLSEHRYRASSANMVLVEGIT